MNVLWAERKTTSFNLWAEAQNDKFLYMPRTHATATLVHQNYFGLVIGDATTTAPPRLVGTTTVATIRGPSRLQSSS